MAKKIDLSAMASKGGKQAAANMTPEERSRRAKFAATKRWGADVLKAAYGSADKPLIIAGYHIQAYVLEDGTRILTQGDFQEAMGRHRKANVRYQDEGEEQTPPILQGTLLKPFISDDLRKKSMPVKFRTPEGGLASGYRAEILPEVCEVFLKARDAGVLLQRQVHIAVRADILVRGLASVGIIALVDEATGYQYERPRLELAEYLAIYINKKLAAWVSTFPPEFYSQIYRLKGWRFNPDSTARTPEVGKLTNDLVYSRLAPFVLEELKRITPKDDKGRRKHKFFQRLTPDPGGLKKLEDHFKELLAIMKGYDDRDWKGFYKHANRAIPQLPQEPDLFSSMPDGNAPEVIEG